MSDHEHIKKLKAELRIMGLNATDYQLYSEVIEDNVVALEFRFRDKPLFRLPSQLFKISTLNILTINNIVSLSSDIVKLKNLRLLELIRFQEEIFPKFIVELENLEVLIISRSLVKYLPKEIFEHPNLRDLDLIENQIEYVPEEIVNLPKLEYISLSGFTDTVETLTKVLLKMPNLRKLYLGKFKHDLFPEIWYSLCKLTNLINLTIFGYPSDDYQLKHIPPVINNLVNLQSLWIDGGIMCFPDIPDLKQLRELSLFAAPLNNNSKAILNSKRGVCIDPDCVYHQDLSSY